VCRVTPVRFVAKVLLIGLLVVVGLPLWLAYVVFDLLTNLIMVVLLAFFIMPVAALCEENYNWTWILLGLIFFPITFLVFLARAFKEIFID